MDKNIVKLCNAHLMGDVAIGFYKLEEGNSLADFFRTLNEAISSLGNVSIKENVESDMQTIEGDYDYKTFMSNLEIILEVLNESAGNPTITVPASLQDDSCSIVCYPKTNIIEQRAKYDSVNKCVKNGLEAYLKKKAPTFKM